MLKEIVNAKIKIRNRGYAVIFFFFLSEEECQCHVHICRLQGGLCGLDQGRAHLGISAAAYAFLDSQMMN